MNFKNKKVLITGASSDLGKSLATKLQKLGAIVIGTYNSSVITLKNIDLVKCDLSKESEINDLFNHIKKEYSTLDYVINCAALSKDRDITEKTKEEFMSVLEVNLVGTFLICKNALSMMDDGVIVNISSTNASTTFSPFSMDYDASKAGIENLTKNLALRFSNIKICALAPNWIATESVLEMSPVYLNEELKRVKQKKLLTKEEVVNKIIEIITNDEIKSGEILIMEDSNE